MAEEVVELEGKSVTDGAWYDCEVSIDQKKNSKPRLRMHFVEFTAEEDEYLDTVEDALASLRARSKPMEDSDCSAVKEGDVMLTLQRKASEQKYFDAKVVKIKREPHGSGKSKCKCTFELRWLASDKVGQLARLKFSSLCRTTGNDPKLNKEYAKWLKSMGYDWAPEKSDPDQASSPPQVAALVREESPEKELDKAELDLQIQHLIQTFSAGTVDVDSTPQRALGLHIKQVLQSHGAGPSNAEPLALATAFANGGGSSEVGPGDIAHEALVFGSGVSREEAMERYDVLSTTETSICCHCGMLAAGTLEVAPLEASTSAGSNKQCLKCFVANRTSFLDLKSFRLCYLSPNDILNTVNHLTRLQQLPKTYSQPSSSPAPTPPSCPAPLAASHVATAPAGAAYPAMAPSPAAATALSQPSSAPALASTSTPRPPASSPAAQVNQAPAVAGTPLKGETFGGRSGSTQPDVAVQGLAAEYDKGAGAGTTAASRTPATVEPSAAGPGEGAPHEESLPRDTDAGLTNVDKVAVSKEAIMEAPHPDAKDHLPPASTPADVPTAETTGPLREYGEKGQAALPTAEGKQREASEGGSAGAADSVRTAVTAAGKALATVACMAADTSAAVFAAAEGQPPDDLSGLASTGISKTAESPGGGGMRATGEEFAATEQLDGDILRLAQLEDLHEPGTPFQKEEPDSTGLLPGDSTFSALGKRKEREATVAGPQNSANGPAPTVPTDNTPGSRQETKRQCREPSPVTHSVSSIFKFLV